MALLAVVWRLHPAVIAVYTEEPDPISFQLGGGDYAFERTPLEPSPFVVDVVAPDLRAVALPAVASASGFVPFGAVRHNAMRSRFGSQSISER